MTDLFLAFLEISIPISFIIAVLLLLTPFLNKRYAAKWKYWIWIVLALRLIIPLGGNGGQPAAEIQPPKEALTSSESEKTPPVAPADGTVRGRVIVEIPAQMTTPIVKQPEKAGSNISMLDIMALVWMLGSLLLISVNMVSYFLYKHEILKKGKAVTDKDVLRLLQELKQELRINCTVAVIEYREAASPLLIGFFHPILVLPKAQYNMGEGYSKGEKHSRGEGNSTGEGYSREELFFILKHELIHLKRGDIYFKLLFVVANAVHWYNPLIRIMQKEAAVDMELSCDERVTQGADHATRKAYTETLLSALHKQNANKTVLSTGFYGGKQIMKKRFQNILAKTGKKNGAVVLICALILAVSLGTLVGCSIMKENAEAEPGQLGTKDSEIKDSETKDIQVDNSQIDEPLPESGNSSSETEPSLDDCSIMIEDISLSINENKQDILAKLDEADLDYSEFKPDNPEKAQYDSCYNIAGGMQIYFLNDACVRLRMIGVDRDEIVQTVRGIKPRDTYFQMVEKYGDDYETHTYSYKGIYTIYRYSIGDCICEFGMADIYDIYNIDIYLPSQFPIYDYGEEVIN